MKSRSLKHCSREPRTWIPTILAPTACWRGPMRRVSSRDWRMQQMFSRPPTPWRNGRSRRDPEDPWSHLAAGYVHMVSRGFDPAVRELSEAIELNPSLAFAHVVLGLTYGYGGMGDDGLHHLAIAARLSPRDFTYAANFSATGLCYFMKRRFADAVECERRAVELHPNFGTAWRTLAAAAGLAGELDTAIHALSEAKRLQPSLSVDFVDKFHPIVHEKDRALYRRVADCRAQIAARSPATNNGAAPLAARAQRPSAEAGGALARRRKPRKRRIREGFEGRGRRACPAYHQTLSETHFFRGRSHQSRRCDKSDP